MSSIRPNHLRLGDIKLEAPNKTKCFLHQSFAKLQVLPFNTSIFKHNQSTIMTDSNPQVLIVGGGIVGLTASLFLSYHNITSLLVERHTGTSIHPRGRSLNARSMEIYRSLGIDEDIRAAGAELGPAMGIYRGASLASVIEPHKRSSSDAPARKIPGAWLLDNLGPVGRAWATQDMTEHVLLAAARQKGGDVRFNTEPISFTQDSSGVTAIILDRLTGLKSTVKAAYLIAADGAESPIRKHLDISTTGSGPLGHLLNISFEADLTEFVKGREFSLCLINRPEDSIRGLFNSINNSTRWGFHLSYSPPSGPSPSDFSPETCAEIIKIALGIPNVDVKVKAILPWEPTVKVVTKMQVGRVFFAGEAAHQMPPWGGQGANSGIADVHNLAWKLAFVLNNHSSPSLLSTYEAERFPSGEIGR